jgi:hypothetical protein
LSILQTLSQPQIAQSGWNQRKLCKLSSLLSFVQGGHMSEMRGERLQVMLSPEELATVDDFRFRHRMPTRAAAVRELLKFGLAAIGVDGTAGVKSSDYGVFNRGPEGHRDAKDSSGTE